MSTDTDDLLAGIVAKMDALTRRAEAAEAKLKRIDNALGTVLWIGDKDLADFVEENASGWAESYSLREQLAALQADARRLASKVADELSWRVDKPFSGSWKYSCRFCESANDGPPEAIPHTDNCPVSLARAILAALPQPTAGETQGVRVYRCNSPYCPTPMYRVYGRSTRCEMWDDSTLLGESIVKEWECTRNKDYVLQGSELAEWLASHPLPSSTPPAPPKADRDVAAPLGISDSDGVTPAPPKAPEPTPAKKRYVLEECESGDHGATSMVTNGGREYMVRLVLLNGEVSQ